MANVWKKDDKDPRLKSGGAKSTDPQVQPRKKDIPVRITCLSCGHDHRPSEPHKG